MAEQLLNNSYCNSYICSSSSSSSSSSSDCCSCRSEDFTVIKSCHTVMQTFGGGFPEMTTSMVHGCPGRTQRSRKDLVISGATPPSTICVCTA